MDQEFQFQGASPSIIGGVLSDTLSLQIRERYPSLMEQSAARMAETLRSLYQTSYAFPAWVNEASHWQTHKFQESMLFYSAYDNDSDVIVQCVEREPVNIGMNHGHDIDALKHQFGWSVGGYARSTDSQLMPNIAIYCHATVKHGAFTGLFHVLNLVGLAFDSWQQPDAKYFLRGAIHDTYIIKEHRLSAIVIHYEQMWNYVRSCIEMLTNSNKNKTPSIQRVIMSNVGANNFAALLGLDEYCFVKTIQEPATESLKLWLHDQKIDLVEFPIRGHHYFNIHNAAHLKNPPSFLKLPPHWPETTLFLNAWDPWSIIGNGNARDSSLDGYWGRISNMSVLGWPITNRDMIYVKVTGYPPTTSYEDYVRKKVKDGDKAVILITTGAYNPVHSTHLSLTQTAMDTLNQDQTFVQQHGQVVAVVMSPSSDAYVFAKDTVKSSHHFQVSSMHRLQMIRLGIQDRNFPNIFVDRWEMDQRDDNDRLIFIDYPQVVQHYQTVWNQINNSVTVMYLCGSDHAFKLGLTHINGPSTESPPIHIVVVSRGDEVLTPHPTRHVISISHDSSYDHTASSSTAARDAITTQDRQCLTTLLPPSVLKYIDHYQLYK